jgi:hypothetical protein
VTRRSAALLQGGYYLLTGIWPILSMATFEAVTGPKTDDWLVHTVGVLVIVVGAVLLVAAAQHAVHAPVVLLAVGSASGLAAIEFYYVLRGVIWPIYMLDAVGELVLIALWAIAVFRDRRDTVRGSTTREVPTTGLIQPTR